MVALGFCPKILLGGGAPTNDTLSLYQCRLGGGTLGGGGDTQTLPAVIEFVCLFFFFFCTHPSWGC